MKLKNLFLFVLLLSTFLSFLPSEIFADTPPVPKTQTTTQYQNTPLRPAPTSFPTGMIPKTQTTTQYPGPQVQPGPTTFPTTCAGRYLQVNSIQSLINSASCLVTDAIKVTVPVALVIFLWGLARFILAGGDEERIKTGKTLMIWGIIALFVMVSVWGIVTLLQSNLGVSNTGFPDRF